MKRRKPARHVPLSPMQIGQRESERIAAAFTAADASGLEQDRAEATHMREQLALHAS